MRTHFQPLFLGAALVGLWPGNAPAQTGGEVRLIGGVVTSYYQASQSEDWEAYAAVMDTQSRPVEVMHQQATQVWAAVDVTGYRIEGLKVAFGRDGRSAVAEYLLRATIRKQDSPEDAFSVQAPYVMLLHRSPGGEWKVVDVKRRDVFYENLKSLFFLDEALRLYPEPRLSGARSEASPGPPPAADPASGAPTRPETGDRAGDAEEGGAD